MNAATKKNTYAAVDLGSNSFHMLVTRREHGELRVLDRIKEMVRLGGGLDGEGNLDDDTEARALACLSRFGQRLRGIPAENMRAVGTQTFRRLQRANDFLLAAERSLGCPVDIVAGREEARLIYLGVTQWVASDRQRQLVMDIGGGSTELVIGEGVSPLEMESLPFGCVSVTNRFFSNGVIDADSLTAAQRAVLTRLQDIQGMYRNIAWQTAVGSSGTIRSAAAICVENGWSERGITRDALQRLKHKTLEFHHIDELRLGGLSARRQPVFIGGLAILLACFQALDIDTMVISPYALREGLLNDLLGRLEHRDPRVKAVSAFRSRFSVNPGQVERVRDTALKLFDSLSDGQAVNDSHRLLLSWAAELHETGLALAHEDFQLHSAYLVEHSDMAGFSRQEQQFLAALVGFQRGALPGNYANRLPRRLHGALRVALLCIRLACVFCRTREDDAIPDFTVGIEASHVRLGLAMDWKDNHPLTIADLEQETRMLAKTGLELDVVYTSSTEPT